MQVVGRMFYLECSCTAQEHDNPSKLIKTHCLFQLQTTHIAQKIRGTLLDIFPDNEGWSQMNEMINEKWKKSMPNIGLFSLNVIVATQNDTL